MFVTLHSVGGVGVTFGLRSCNGGSGCFGVVGVVGNVDLSSLEEGGDAGIDKAGGESSDSGSDCDIDCGDSSVCAWGNAKAATPRATTATANAAAPIFRADRSTAIDSR